MQIIRNPVIPFTLLLTAASALPDRLPSIAPRQTSCPSVWNDVASDLKSTFIGSDGLCTDDARAAIRLSFHDCFPDGGCDGSILLTDECSRTENQQMTDICGKLLTKVNSYNVSAADMVQFASAIGIVSCPGGPAVSFYAGRTSSSTLPPTGQMPGPDSNATFLISQFAARGLSSDELVALVGAHTAGKQLTGADLDSTPGKWDATYYTETADGTAPSSIVADQLLANSSQTSTTFKNMGTSNSAFAGAFVPAFEKMSLIGNDQSSLTDCSSVISSNVNTKIRARKLQA